MTNSVSLAFLFILTCGILKILTVAGQEHCNGPFMIGEVTAVGVSTDPQAASVVNLTMTSEFDLIPYFSYNQVQVISFRDDGSGMIARKSRRGNESHFSVHSTTPINISSLVLELLADHPCNTIMMRSEFEFFLAMYEQGISLPKVSTMPKKGYRLSKDENFSLRFGVTYMDDGRLARQGKLPPLFQPMFQWLDSNVMENMEEVMRNRRGPNMRPPRKSDQRQWNTTSGGFTTFVTQLDTELGDSFPIDGAVLHSPVSFTVNRKGTYDRRPSVYIAAVTTVHFTDDPYGLPVYVASWLGGQKFVHKLGLQKGGRYNVISVGVNPNLQNRLVTCLSAGIESAPVMAVAKIESGNPMKGVIGRLRPVDQIFPGARFGSLGFAAFEGNTLSGGEAYYLCSASNGSDVTNTIVKTIKWAPVQAEVRVPNVNERPSNGRMEVNCTVTGYPKPTMRLFLMPDGEIMMFSHPDRIFESHLKYELTESTDLVTVTTISTNPLKKSVSFDWAPMMQKYSTSSGFYFKCLATNEYEEELKSGYLFQVD